MMKSDLKASMERVPRDYHVSVRFYFAQHTLDKDIWFGQASIASWAIGYQNGKLNPIQTAGL